MPDSTPFDPVSFEVIRHALLAVAEEMGAALQHSALRCGDVLTLTYHDSTQLCKRVGSILANTALSALTTLGRHLGLLMSLELYNYALGNLEVLPSASRSPKANQVVSCPVASYLTRAAEKDAVQYSPGQPGHSCCFLPPCRHSCTGCGWLGG